MEQVLLLLLCLLSIVLCFQCETVTHGRIYSVYFDKPFTALPQLELVAKMKGILKSDNLDIVERVDDVSGTLVYVSCMLSSKPMNRVNYTFLEESKSMYDELVLVYIDANDYEPQEECDASVIDGLSYAKEMVDFGKPVSSLLFHFDVSKRQLLLCYPSDERLQLSPSFSPQLLDWIRDDLHSDFKFIQTTIVSHVQYRWIQAVTLISQLDVYRSVIIQKWQQYLRSLV